MQINEVSANIKRIRKVRGMTMQKAAEAAGISRMAYHNIENGSWQPPETGKIIKCKNI